MKPLAIVTGVGPGTGSAIVRRLHEGGYQVGMIARDAARLQGLAEELPASFALPCDVTDTERLHMALDTASARGGIPKLVVHNAVGGAFGNFEDVEPDVLESNFAVNVMSLFHIARWAGRPMAKAGGGSIIVTGNTSSLRGKANFAGFAPTKAAQRILCESIARELGPVGVHVAYLVIDAVIDVLWTRMRFPDMPEEFYITPSAIADEIWHLAQQPKSAWTFLAEIRPFGEKW